jgi:hypothetical protein
VGNLQTNQTVAKYYEGAAAQLQAKVKEQKELLEQYENKSYLYGRQAHDLRSHTAALIHDYEKSVEASTKEAALHRQMLRSFFKITQPTRIDRIPGRL